MRKNREATFERIIANAPAAFSPAQLRVLLRAIVNLDPYTFADDLADDIAGENEQRTAEEVPLRPLARTPTRNLPRSLFGLHLRDTDVFPAKASMISSQKQKVRSR